MTVIKKFIAIPDVRPGDVHTTDRMTAQRRSSVFAKRALVAAYPGTDIEENGVATTISDLIADLRHLSDHLGLDYEQLDDAAQLHHDAERLVH